MATVARIPRDIDEQILSDLVNRISGQRSREREIVQRADAELETRKALASFQQDLNREESEMQARFIQQSIDARGQQNLDRPGVTIEDLQEFEGETTQMQDLADLIGAGISPQIITSILSNQSALQRTEAGIESQEDVARIRAEATTGAARTRVIGTIRAAKIRAGEKTITVDLFNSETGTKQKVVVQQGDQNNRSVIDKALSSRGLNPSDFKIGTEQSGKESIDKATLVAILQKDDGEPLSPSQKILLEKFETDPFSIFKEILGDRFDGGSRQSQSTEARVNPRDIKAIIDLISDFPSEVQDVFKRVIPGLR